MLEHGSDVVGHRLGGPGPFAVRAEAVAAQVNGDHLVGLRHRGEWRAEGLRRVDAAMQQYQRRTVAMDFVVDFGGADRDLARAAGCAHRIVSCGLGNDGRCNKSRSGKGEGYESAPQHDGSS